MTERDRLEREIHQLTQIIAADAFALASKSTPGADRAGLQRQIAIRSAQWAGLLKKLSGASTLETTELGVVPRAQAEARSRSQAHQGDIAANPVSPARPH
jgi:hypothetical protein